MRSAGDPLAFLGIESALPRPAQPPTAPVGRPSRCLFDAESFGFATAQNVRLAPGESVSVPYAASGRPVARLLVCLSGPPVREVKVRSGRVEVERVAERTEHGQRIGGVAVLHPVTAADFAGPCCLLENNSGDKVLEGILCDMF